MSWDAGRYAEEVEIQEAKSGRKLREGLCCECGAHFMKWRSPYFGELRVRDPEPFEMRTFIAKCEPCGRRTKHARLSPQLGVRDYVEMMQHVAVDGWPVPDWWVEVSGWTKEQARDQMVCEYLESSLVDK